MNRTDGIFSVFFMSCLAGGLYLIICGVTSTDALNLGVWQFDGSYSRDYPFIPSYDQIVSICGLAATGAGAFGLYFVFVLVPKQRFAMYLFAQETFFKLSTLIYAKSMEAGAEIPPPPTPPWHSHIGTKNFSEEELQEFDVDFRRWLRDPHIREELARVSRKSVS